jgi:hypothetical protein
MIPDLGDFFDEGDEGDKWVVLYKVEECEEEVEGKGEDG